MGGLSSLELAVQRHRGLAGLLYGPVVLFMLRMVALYRDVESLYPLYINLHFWLNKQSNVKETCLFQSNTCRHNLVLELKLVINNNQVIREVNAMSLPVRIIQHKCSHF